MRGTTQLVLLLGAVVPLLMAPVTTKIPSDKVTFTPDAASQWILAPTELDAAMEDLVDQTAASTFLFDWCRQGYKGVGYDATTGLYLATCGSYNWSAEEGDATSPTDTATTVGGNSWTMSCTGDGTATGSPPEEVVCLRAGESIKMYSTADIMLAFNRTKVGGKVYLPRGSYHLGGCGQDESQVSNGCPVLSRWPYQYQRHVQMFGGVKLVGEGSQRSDPVVSGRVGTWLISDLGRGGNTGDADTDDSGATFERWTNMSGLGRQVRHCETTTALTADGCSLTYATEDPKGKVGYTRLGRAGELLGSNTQGTSVVACIDDTLSTTGLCSGNRLIRCTDNGARTGANTGGCGEYGTCYGFATTLVNALAAGEELDAAWNIGSCTYGDTGTTCDAQAEGSLGRINEVSGACESSQGLYVRSYIPSSSSERFWPFPWTKIDVAQQATTLGIVDMTEFNNLGGGFQDLSFMQANWPGRDSPNDSADCADGGETVGCDGVELVNIHPSLYGGLDRVAVWYSGDGREFSTIDGSPLGFQGHISDSYISKTKGFASDASGWRLRNNNWVDNDCGSFGCIGSSFSPMFDIEGDTFIRNSGAALVRVQHARLTRIVNIHAYQNVVSWGLVRMTKGGHILIDGIQGYGNEGPVVVVDPDDDYTLWGISIRNINLTAHDLIPWWSAAPHAVFVLMDGYDSDSSTSDVMSVLVDNVTVDTGNSPDGCLIWLEGGLGDESDKDNGLSRFVDDARHRLHFSNMQLNEFGSGTSKAFCLGNVVNGQENASNRLGDIWDSVGGMPSWTNIRVNSDRFPDNPWASEPASEVEDCNNLPQGAVVRIHDDTTADGTCAATAGVLTGGSTFNSVCKCDGAGTWSAL